METINYIIPLCRCPDNRMHGEDFPERKGSLKFILDEFLGRQTGVKLKVILIEQSVDGEYCYLDDSTLLDPSSKLDVVNIRVKHPVFNKSWLYNLAVQKAEGPHLMFSESDIFCFDNFMSNFLKHVNSNNIPWTLAWNLLCYISKNEKSLIFKERRPVPHKGNFRLQKPTPGKGSEGGIVYFHRDYFEKIGRYNEWMEGLGGIDNEILMRAKFESGMYHQYDNLIYHLWHPIVKDDAHPDQQRKKNSTITKHTSHNQKFVIDYLRKHCKSSTKMPACKVEDYGGIKK